MLVKGGKGKFIKLSDTPDSYIGSSLKFTRVNVGETALEFQTLAELLAHADLSDMPDTAGTVSDHDARYYTETEIGSTTDGSSGASLVGLPSLDATPATVRTFMDGVSSSIYYTGGLITENSANDGTIDISEVSGAIKLTTTDATMASFTVSALVGQALDDDGQNFIVIDYNGGTPKFDVVTSEPNHSTVMSIGTVYREATTNILHILQGGHEFTDMPWKTQRRFSKVDGYQRGTGLACTESLSEDLGIVMTAGTLYRGVAEFSLIEWDTGSNHNINDVSANNTIVLENAEGDVTDHYENGTFISIHGSTGTTNDGCYSVSSSSWNGTNTTIIINETTLTTGLADDGHLHYQTFRPYYYDGSNWVNGDHDGNACDINLSSVYYNDITSGLELLTTNRYGVHWIYKDLHGDMFKVYGQGNYSLTQAKEAEPPSSLPDIISKIGYFIAKVIVQQGETSWNSVFYPWSTTFSATGASVHNDLGGLQGGKISEYYHQTASEENSTFAWVIITGTQTAVVGEAYLCNSAGAIELTLPASASVGQVIRAHAMGAGGWKIVQPANVTINFGNMATTTGASGYLESTVQRDAVEMVCTVANTGWDVVSSIGSITVV